MTRQRGSTEMRSAGNFLQKPKGRLATIMAQGQRMAHISRLINMLLPLHLQNQVRLQSMSPLGWTLQTHSSAWATRLRYVLPGLRQQLEAELKQPVPELKLRVIPPPETPNPQPLRRPTLSQSNAELLKNTAHSIENKQLGAALMRLAQRCNSSDTLD